MKQLFIAFIFIATSVFSQEKITKNLGDFNTVKAYRGLHIELVKSSSPKIEIRGPKSEEVTIKNVDGVLKISLKIEETFAAEDVEITLFYNDDLKTLDVNEGAIISSDKAISQEKIELKAQEAGKIKVTLDTEYLTVKSISGGVIRVLGSSDNQDITANTGGMFDGSRLKSKRAKAHCSTGSEINVNATDDVEANASLGGTITVSGSPKELEKKESLGGYVRH